MNQENIRVVDVKAIKLCTRVNDQYHQTWHSNIPTHVRCSCTTILRYIL